MDFGLQDIFFSEMYKIKKRNHTLKIEHMSLLVS